MQQILNIKFLFVLLVALVAVPQVSSAYFTTAQKAVEINEDTFLYTVTYKFGTEKYDLRMPVGAVHGLAFGATSTYLGYKFVDDNGLEMTKGDSYAIVLSKADIIDNEYVVKKGEVAEFTLVTLLKIPVATIDTLSGSDFDLAMQVTSLPFIMTSSENEVFTKLNPSELKYYTTPTIDLK